MFNCNSTYPESTRLGKAVLKAAMKEAYTGPEDQIGYMFFMGVSMGKESMTVERKAGTRGDLNSEQPRVR